MQGKISQRELQGVANLFISPDDRESFSTNGDQHRAPDIFDKKDTVEIEESYKIEKKVVFPSTSKGQLELKKYILELINQDFDIIKLEMKKLTNISTNNIKTLKEENLFIKIKDI